MSDVITTRLPNQLDKDLTVVAKTEHLDKSTVVRRLLSRSISEWKKEHAVKLYTEKIYSTEQAAHFASLSIWEFFDLLKQRKVPSTYDVEELERDIRNIGWNKR